MKKFTHTIIFCLIISSTFAQSVAPEVVSSSGDYFENSTVSLSWTIGECLTEDYSSSSNILTQGFHQGKYSTSTLVDNLPNNSEVMVYPNPTNDVINIKVAGLPGFSDGYKIKLFDLNGKLLISKDVEKPDCSLNIGSFNSGVFILNIIDNNQLLKSVKIQKIN